MTLLLAQASGGNAGHFEAIVLGVVLSLLVVLILAIRWAAAKREKERKS